MMPFMHAWLILLAASLSSAMAEPSLSLAQRRSEAYRRAAENVAPSLVQIERTGIRGSAGVDTAAATTGTGLVVAEDGWIITSDFWLRDAPEGIVVTLPDGDRLSAQRVGTDHLHQLALLKVNRSGLPLPTIAPRSQIRSGQTALALGRTWGHDRLAISAGIVSATDRMAGKAIQTDAKISPSNYGGALIDLEGRVLGLITPVRGDLTAVPATATLYDSGIGFAIPLVDIRERLPLLKQGNILPGLAGISFRERESVLGSTRLGRLAWRGPAARAGLREGDRIVDIDGRTVARRLEVQEYIARRQAGDSVALTVERQEGRRTFTLDLVAQLPTYRWPILGVDATESKNGLLIDSVLSGSPAAQAGLTEGALIKKINDQAVTKRAELRRFVDERDATQALRVQWQLNGNLRVARITPVPFPPNRVPATDLPSKDVRFKTAEKRLAKDLTYWTLTPDGRGADEPLGLALTFVGPKTPQRATLASRWSRACTRRGWLLCAVETGKKLEDGRSPAWQNAARVLDDVQRHFPIDPERIVVHGAGGAVPMAYQFALARSKQVHGLLLIGAGPIPLPMPAPATRLALAFLLAEKDPRRDAIRTSLRALRENGYPVYVDPQTLVTDGYPSATTIENVLAWYGLLGYL